MVGFKSFAYSTREAKPPAMLNIFSLPNSDIDIFPTPVRAKFFTISSASVLKLRFSY